MTLTPQQRNLLKRLVEKPNGEIALGFRTQRDGEELERAGYVTVSPPTRGDPSVLIFNITDAGRRTVAATEP